MNFLKKYNYKWVNKELHQKATKYYNIMMAVCALTLILLFTLPEAIKFIVIVTILVAGYCWFKAYQLQNQDKKLRQTIVPQK